MKKTVMPKPGSVPSRWWIVDAKDQVVGRLSTVVASVLRGKHKPTFTPHVLNGDHVIIINADKVVFTGKKWDTKAFYRTSGRPGGLSTETYKRMRQDKPERVLEYSIKGMLPKTHQGREMFQHVKIYAGEVHPHVGQKPEPLAIKR
jgi:large subunit ribosomal protein L13